MATIGKVSPIKKQYSTEHGQSLASSLATQGYTRFPGTVDIKTPYKERNGEYRTGLDPNAIYIKGLPKEEQIMEIERVTALRDELQSWTGLDLSPRSKYYTEMFRGDEQENTATYAKLIDGPNTFNLSVPEHAIAYAWLRVHPLIAPNYSAWERGVSNSRCPKISECQFFIDDEEYESEIAYKENVAINSAISALDAMTPTRQLKVAKLLNLPLSYNSKPSIIYNALSKYIKEATTKNSKALANVKNFNNISNMADENIEIRFNIKEALDFNIFRKGKNGKILEGEVLVAESEDEAIEYFSNKKHQDDYLALKKKIKEAQIIDIS